MWMCAAMAAPDRCENVSFHVTLALSFASSTAVPLKLPVAPAGTPVGLGTSDLAFRLAETLYESPCAAASASPESASATTATAPIVLSIGPPSFAYLGSSEDPGE